MAEHGKGKDGGGGSDKGKGPVANYGRPVITYDPVLVRQAILSIRNLRYDSDPVSNATAEIINEDADTNLIPVINPVQFWTACNGCHSLFKCEMICRNDCTSTICPHNDYKLLTSDQADLPDIYRSINKFVYTQQCSQFLAANKNPNDFYGSLAAGLGSSNSTSSKCSPFPSTSTAGCDSKMATVVQTYRVEKQKGSESSSSFVQGFYSKFSGETPEDFGSLPSEIYNRAVADWKYFYQTLICVTNVERRNFQIPSIDGMPLNLYRIFIEVTSRGGIQKVMEDDRLKEVCANLAQKIEEYYLFATYMAQLDFYEYLVFRLPNEKRIHRSRDLSSRERRPFQGAIGTGVSSMQVQDSVGIQRKPRMIAFQHLAPPAMPMPDQRSVEPSFYEAQAEAAAKRQKLITRPFGVPASSLSAEQVSLQRAVRPVATEAQAASIQQKEANFLQAPSWSIYAIPGSAYRQFDPQSNSAATMETTISNIKPFAPGPSSNATQVSSQTSATHVSAAQTVAESTGISNQPITPSADTITLGEQRDNQMKADETRAGAEDDSDGFGSQKGKKRRKRHSRK